MEPLSMISIQIGDAGIGLGLAWACPLLSEVRANFRNKLGMKKVGKAPALKGSIPKVKGSTS